MITKITKIDDKIILEIDNAISEELCKKYAENIYNRILSSENAIYIDCPKTIIDLYNNKEITDEIYNIIKNKNDINCLGNIYPNDLLFTSRYGIFMVRTERFDNRFNKNAKITYEDFSKGINFDDTKKGFEINIENIVTPNRGPTEKQDPIFIPDYKTILYNMQGKTIIQSR